MKAFEGKFHLEFGEPRVVVQGVPGDQHWGHYNFPDIHYTKNGNILATWAYGDDAIDGKAHEGGVKPPFLSTDGGKTWEPNNDREQATPKWKMKDGKYFLGFISKGAYPVTYLDAYTPAVTWLNGQMFLFFAEDVKEPEDTTVRARIYDPETDTVETYEPVINWPHTPLTQYFGKGKRVFPLTKTFALSNCGIIEKDGILYMCLYMYGFDSKAKTREEAVMKYSTKYSVYIFTSEDCGRTFNYQDQLSIDDETFDEKGGFEGFCEPMMDRMPDGSFVMLIRTGSNHKSYISRSTDNCKTWSKPAVFDEIGVLPQILTLECGVTIATYGRPDMRVRATSDPAGLKWEDPIIVDLYGMKVENPFYRSCFYTRLLPVDDTTALWVYTDFQYPNPDGEGVKTVLVREIKVVKD